MTVTITPLGADVHPALPVWAILMLGPMGGLTIAITGCWLFLRRFQQLQDQLFTFFRQELQDCQARYTELVKRITKER